MDNSKIGHHISEQFNKELEDIRNKVLIMGGLVERQIELAVQAFTTGDMELAELVIKQDNQVDALEMARRAQALDPTWEFPARIIADLEADLRRGGVVR